MILNAGFISSLIEYGIEKIPRNCQNEHQAPLIYSIGHLMQRIFLFFKLGLTENNGMVVGRLCSEFFKKCQSEPQAKTIMKKLSHVLAAEVAREHQQTNTSNQLSNLVAFIDALRSLLTSSTSAPPSPFAGYQSDDYMSILYSVLNLALPLLDKQLADSHFMALVAVLQSLIIKILTLDLNFESKASARSSADRDDEDDAMDAYDSSGAPMRDADLPTADFR